MLRLPSVLLEQRMRYKNKDAHFELYEHASIGRLDLQSEVDTALLRQYIYSSQEWNMQT